MSVYALDANIVSYYLKENALVIGHIEEALIAGDEIVIGPIAYYEVRRGLLALGSPERLRKFERFCQMFSVGRLDNQILDTAADIYVDLRKQGRIIADADILIAAYCINNSFTLVTGNVKHFEYVQNLHFVDWTN